MKDLKVIFMGTPFFSVPIFETLINNTNVIAVVTAPDALIGRKKILTPSPVKQLALENNIKVFTPIKLKDDYADILKLNPDIIITCAYGQIVPEEIINFPRLGCINIHASLLPKYRGASPIRSVLLNGEKQTGISLMYMDKTLDTGDIIIQKSINIDILDNNKTLSNKLCDLASNLLITELPKIASGKNQRLKQNNKEATYVGLIKREDEHLNFNDKSDNIYNKIRAFSPDIYANFILDDKEYKVIEATPTITDKEYINQKPGTIISKDKTGIIIKTKDSGLLITKIKPIGKNIMKVTDFINGYRDEIIGKVVK